MKIAPFVLAIRLSTVALLFTALWHPVNASAQQNLLLVAHYTLANSSGLYQADSSGNNNNINGGGSWVSDPDWGSTTNAIAGGAALTLDGGENLSFNPGPGQQAFDSWLGTYYGSFSISLWINTTNVQGNDSDTLNCCDDTHIIDAYNNGVNDTIPIALTGHKVAFFTGDPTGNNGDTLHSTNSVTTGNWMHVVVTRDLTTGQKNIYINGVLDSSDVGVTNPLDGDTGNFDIGGGLGTSYVGALDDMQIYSGVLTASNVMYLYDNPGLTVTNIPNTIDPVAFYDFDENTPFAADLTADGYNLINGGSFAGPILTNDAVSGSGAVYFNGNTFLTASSNLLTTLASNFSLSIWIKTTQTYGSDGEPAYQGAGIVAEDVPGLVNDLVPVALAGGGIGFNTGGTADQTLNSTTDINDGNYHHVVVTRNETTGVKQIYIDGVLNTNQTASTGLLNAPQLITIGALADASNPDPASPTSSGYGGFNGEMDDIQVYSRVLSSADVQSLHASPSTSLTNLVVKYDFDEGAVLAADESGNGNNMLFAGNIPGASPQITSDSISGAGALNFEDDSFLTQNDLETNLAGSFSISVWLETTQFLGSVGQPAYDGAGVVTAETASQTDDLIPIALTGGNVAFETDGSVTDVLTSVTAINDGNYHHVVVTRDGTTGAKQIYIDGVLNTNDVADTAVLNSPQMLILGCQADASQSNPNSPSIDGYNAYNGEMDQLQVYSRVLSSNEVAYLYDNPGATIYVPETNAVTTPPPPPPTNNIGEALGETNLTWTTSGDANWFVESTNTYTGSAEAAQSGSITGSQMSVLQTTINGAYQVSFDWSTLTGNDDQFNLQFFINGNYQRQITGQWPWTPEIFFTGPGSNTLEWVANAGSSASDAGFLDQVVLTPSIAPVITVNPFSQTNYPGYQVVLQAAATGTPTPTWQWYQEGNPSPLPGATSALYIPNNSGQSSVAGTYYAIASNNAGSAMTFPATVTFSNILAAPGWTGAFASPLYNYTTTYYTESTNVYYSCAVDGTGTNVYSSGYDLGNSYYYDFFNNITGIYGNAAGIIIKQNLNVTHPVQWVAAITNNGAGNAYCEGLALAPTGGVYAVGQFTGANWLGSMPLNDAGEGTTFLAQFDANGNLLWITTITNSFPVENGVVSDTNGNVTLTAVVDGSTTIAGTSYLGTGQSSFLAQFNSAGSLNWVDHASNPIEYLAGGNGRIYASCINYFNNTPSIGGITNTTDRNWSVAAVNAANGAGIWLNGAGEASGSGASGILDDVPEIAVSSTNVFLVGTSYGTNAAFGAYNLAITNGRGQYFARYDTNGNAELVTGFGSANTQPWAAVATAAGNIYVTGAFDTYTFFGNYLLGGPHHGTFDSGLHYSQSFLAKFNQNGVPQWALPALAIAGPDQPVDFINLFDVAIGGDNVWVAGTGNGPAEFNNIEPSSNIIFTNDTTISFPSGMVGLLTDNTITLAPVTLIDTMLASSQFEFSFLSDTGHTNYVQYTTNLVNANWQPYSTIVGDGTLKTVQVSPNHPAEFFRVQTQ